MAKMTRSEALARQRNYRSSQFRKNTIYVDKDTGEVFAQDDHLREIMEGRVYYNTVLDGFTAKPIPGITVRSRM